MITLHATNAAEAFRIELAELRPLGQMKYHVGAEQAPARRWPPG